MLSSLHVTNFRAFRDLRIERIAKVNLIVGRNNVGKTSLLEAVHIYSSNDALSAIVRLLERRQEYSIEKGARLMLFNSLFHDSTGNLLTIEIGEANDDDEQLIIHPMWRWAEETEQEDGIQLRAQFSSHFPEGIDPKGADVTEVLTARRGTESIQAIPMEVDSYPRTRSRNRKYNDSLFLPSLGFQDDSIDTAELWDRVVLTDKEDSVLDALKIIDSGLQRIVLVQGRRAERLAMVKLVERKNMPLRSLGDGMNKLFELTLGLVNTGKDGTFLVDEIDSGLHFTTLVDVWRLVFQTAAKLQVQVFATTHSWECIEAFQKAAAEHPADGLLIRLEQSGEDIRAELFSEKDLAIITRESIEVR